RRQRRCTDAKGILAVEFLAGRRGSGSGADNKLMRRIARPLVALKHSVRKGVSLGQGEVGLYVGLFHVLELHVWRTFSAAIAREEVGAVHLAVVVHPNDVGME